MKTKKSLLLVIFISLLFLGISISYFLYNNTILLNMTNTANNSIEIYESKINGLNYPVGYNLENPTFSFKISDNEGTSLEAARIDIFKSDDLENTLLTKTVKGNINQINFSTEEFYKVLEPRTNYTYFITVKDNKGNAKTSDPFYFETSKLDEDWTGNWITINSEDSFIPIFTKDFTISKPIEKARIYISGLGLYQLYLNDQKVGNEVLTPYYSDYSSEVEYQTYDITSLLENNNNLEVLLGDGWYKGRFGLSGESNRYGDSYYLICEIHLDYKDGSTEVINSDDTFDYYQSFITSNSIYDGEVQDLRISQTNYSPALLTNINDSIELIDRISIPVVEKEELKPIELIVTPNGEYVLDFGQNMAGYIEVNYDLASGSELVLDFGEILQDGNFYDENYRTAESTFTIISDGNVGTTKPLFTYYGFRYVKVSGLSSAPDLNDFTAKVVYSDLPITGNISTGNEKINQLFSNTMWSQKSNFINFPTDCPQRDERLAWTGDAQIFAKTASYNMDTLSFYNKFLRMLKVEQEEMNGGIPVVIPDDWPFEGQTSSVWSDAATFIPDTLYSQYGNLSTLESNYDLMKNWVDYVERQDSERGAKYLWDFGFHFGDWLSQNGRTDQSSLGGTDEAFIASCYWAESTKKVAEAAAELGKTRDQKYYEDLYEKIKSSILNEYFTETGKLAVNTQTAYLVALDFNIYPDKEKLIEDLKDRLYRDLYKITGGFVGAPNMLNVLANNGLNQEALEILLNEDFPGWFYQINLGATTIWERWNSVLPDGTISGTGMNSLNHYAYGSVVNYLYENIGGLKSTETGFKKVTYSPYISNEIGYCDLTYDSVNGTYRFYWNILDNGDIQIDFSVPFGCEVTLELPNYIGDNTVYQAGDYSIVYTPTEDLRVSFDKDTIFRRYIDDPGFIEAVNIASPRLAELLLNKDEETINESLNTLKAQPMLAYSTEEIDNIYNSILSYLYSNL